MIAGPESPIASPMIDEDAGADDRAEAQRGQVEQADDALERRALLLRVADERVGGLVAKRPLRPSCFDAVAIGASLLRRGDDEDGAAGALDQLDRHAAEHLAGDRPFVEAPQTITSASFSSA